MQNKLVWVWALFALLPCAWCAWNWGQVAIGGGGYVVGLIAHPTEPDLVYSRCDVGGIYRFDFPTGRWIPLVDMFGPQQKNFYGGESVAIDPSNPDIVYVALGMYNYWGQGDVLKSYDRGVTWHFTHLNLSMGGNMDMRWGGERLKVNPRKPNEVYFGSRYDGLWRSTTGAEGATAWSLVSSLPNNGTTGYGIEFVEFDPDQGVIYVGVVGVGIYVSTDDTAQEWKFLSGGPQQMLRGVILPGSLIVTSDSGVWKYSNGSWTDISPNSTIQSYSGLTVHPSNPNFIIAAQSAGIFMSAVYRTMDGGKTWDNLTPHVTLHNDVPWWPQDWFAAATAAVVIDPVTPNRAYLTTWFGVYFCDDITSSNTTWYTREMGHEEVFAIVLHVPSRGGEVLVGVADVNGFRSEDFSNFPPTNFVENSEFALQDTTSIDSAVNNPDLVVRVGTTQYFTPAQGGGGYSKDNGQTWMKFPNYPVPNTYAIGGVIAISPDGMSVVWWPFQSMAFHTSDLGNTWIPAKGTPFNNNSCCHSDDDTTKGPLGINIAYPLLLQSDKVNSSIFYILNDGIFSRSEDGGKTFLNVSTLPGDYSFGTNIIMQAVPKMEGGVWVSGTSGLWRSSDYGTTFTRVDDVASSLLFAFGAPKPGQDQTLPAVYVMGTLKSGEGEEDGVYVSNDFGGSWESIEDPNIGLGDNPWSMAADPVTYGQVFVGTLGRGVYVGNAR